MRYLEITEVTDGKRRVIEVIDLDKRYDSSNTANSSEILIRGLLKDIGVPANLSGFNYIVGAISKIINNKSHHTLSMTKEIYKGLAEEFQTTSAAIERCIRTAIQNTWLLKDHPDRFYDVFSTSKLPTNSQFLYSIVEYLRR